MKSKTLKSVLNAFNKAQAQDDNNFEVLNQDEMDLLKGGLSLAKCTCDGASSTYTCSTKGDCTCRGGASYKESIG